jgi:1,2-diacylglycerol 3-beta-galactosyltransferase
MSAPPRTRRVLFLIADTGAGHRSAANAILRAMHMLETSPALSSPRHPAAGSAPRANRLHENSGWDAQIVDAFVECGRFPLRNGISLYGPTIKHRPGLYGRFFHLTNTAERYQTAMRYMRPFLMQGLSHLLLETRPDVIVSVHPLLNHMTLQLLNDLNLRIPFLTVITDLVSIHVSWIAPGVTACAVPTEAAYQLALDAGVPAKRIYLLGMPIDPKFAQPHAGGHAALRQHLGLDPNRPTVLLVGGGDGAIGLGAAVTAVGQSDLAAQMIVVTGRNQQLRAQLEQNQRDFRVPARILGFVDNMPDLMHASDVIVTKAGPGTINEAMACGLPIILTGAIPGQEEGNIDFVRDHQIGVLARTPALVVSALRELLTPDNQRQAELRANVRALSRPEASLDIARLILKHLPPPGTPSAWAKVNARSLPRRYRPRLTRRTAAARRAPRGAATGRDRRLWRVFRLGVDGRPRRILGLAGFMRARTLLIRGTHLGSIQLRRPGSGRRRYDAGQDFGRRGS